MFDHRIPTPAASSPFKRSFAALLLLGLVGIGVYAAGRMGIGRARADGAALSPLSSVRTCETVASRRASASPQASALNGAISVTRATPTLRSTPRAEPISKLAILVFKSEKRLEVWAQRSQNWTQLRDYPVLAASGTAGPKLVEGDCQVPEGVYRITVMNPTSRFHRSMKIDYPNAFDRKMAESDGRIKLGGDICIHGKNCSIGCVAIGDPAIEDLYALVEQVGPKNVNVIMAPNDLRTYIPVKNPKLRLEWLPDLYAKLTRELKTFEKTPR